MINRLGSDGLIRDGSMIKIKPKLITRDKEEVSKRVNILHALA